MTPRRPLHGGRPFVVRVDYEGDPEAVIDPGTIVSENCAINATSRSAASPPSTALDAFATAFVMRTMGPNTVRVSAIDPTRSASSRLVDTAFDITASC